MEWERYCPVSVRCWLLALVVAVQVAVVQDSIRRSSAMCCKCSPERPVPVVVVVMRQTNLSCVASSSSNNKAEARGRSVKRRLRPRNNRTH
uniref:Secreted protein n=1 Tax=Anopheles darlingi TaxID=43151 RepID=A0A2M4DKR9_ANODA